MKILIIGGTGLISVSITQFLINQDQIQEQEHQQEQNQKR